MADNASELQIRIVEGTSERTYTPGESPISPPSPATAAPSSHQDLRRNPVLDDAMGVVTPRVPIHENADSALQQLTHQTQLQQEIVAILRERSPEHKREQQETNEQGRRRSTEESEGNLEQGGARPKTTTEEMPEAIPVEEGAGGAGGIEGLSGLGEAGGAGAGAGMAGLGAGAAVALPVAAVAVGVVAAGAQFVGAVNESTSAMRDFSQHIARNDNMGALLSGADSAARALEHIPVVGQAFGKTIEWSTKIMGRFNDSAQAFIERADQLAGYSPEISAAQGIASVRQTVADIQESQALGEKYGGLIDAESQTSVAIQSALQPIKAELLDVLTEFMEFVKGFVEWAKPAFEVVAEIIKVAWEFFKDAMTTLVKLVSLGAVDLADIAKKGRDKDVDEAMDKFRHILDRFEDDAAQFLAAHGPRINPRPNINQPMHIPAFQ